MTRIVFSEEEIAARVRELGREIDASYPPDEELLMIGLLKGAFVFLSDLARAVKRASLTVDFLVAALYGEGMDPSREVRLLYDMGTPIEGRHVLLVEDIVDSGKTLNRIGDELKRRAPRSLEVCALLHKRLARELRYEPRWVGFEAPPDWLVGYGLDLGEQYRHLPFVAAIDPEDKRGF
ncbi:MAG: hypoxanthine phosphoribosyltransferase [Gemmatimonadota bacterium]|nr:MAG: hypoxanthine phosphoribosyltransferase [Gemmatimonadota bacterium]